MLRLGLARTLLGLDDTRILTSPPSRSPLPRYSGGLPLRGTPGIPATALRYPFMWLPAPLRERLEIDNGHTIALRRRCLGAPRRVRDVGQPPVRLRDRGLARHPSPVRPRPRRPRNRPPHPGMVGRRRRRHPRRDRPHRSVRARDRRGLRLGVDRLPRPRGLLRQGLHGAVGRGHRRPVRARHRRGPVPARHQRPRPCRRLPGPHRPHPLHLEPRRLRPARPPHLQHQCDSPGADGPLLVDEIVPQLSEIAQGLWTVYEPVLTEVVDSFTEERLAGITDR